MSHASRVARALAGLTLALFSLGHLGGQVEAAGRGIFCPGTDVEQEPNDTPATATALQLDFPSRGIGASIGTPGDVDYYSITVGPGRRLWASVDAGLSSGVPPFSRDTLLQVYAAGGAVLLESDDDDGTANGRDYTIESQNASIVAGLSLGAGGTYLLRVSAKSPAAQISPYTLLLGLTNGSQPEFEPNDLPTNAFPTQGAVDATLSSPSDVDYYDLNLLDAGYPMVMVDGDPERDGGGTDTVIEWVSPSSPSPTPPALMVVDSSGALGSPAPPAEGALIQDFQWQRVRITGPAAGTYRVAVLWSGYCPVPVVLDELDVE